MKAFGSNVSGGSTYGPGSGTGGSWKAANSLRKNSCGSSAVFWMTPDGPYLLTFPNIPVHTTVRSWLGKTKTFCIPMPAMEYMSCGKKSAFSAQAGPSQNR